MKYFIIIAVIVGLIIIVYLFNKSSKERALIAAQQADLANIISGGNSNLGTITSQQGGIFGQVSENFGSLAGFFGF